jgi:hypothetical protein
VLDDLAQPNNGVEIGGQMSTTLFWMPFAATASLPIDYATFAAFAVQGPKLGMAPIAGGRTGCSRRTHVDVGADSSRF